MAEFSFPKNTALRFAMVGVFNTLFGSGVMFVAYNLIGCSYWVSSAANYILGSILSYFLNKYFTFTSSGRNCTEMIRFALSIALCYLLAYGFARWGTEWMLTQLSQELRENISMGIGMILFIVLNYTSQKFFVFRKRL